MSYKTIFVFLEGDDDERFFEKILRPIFKKNYDTVKPHQYSRKDKKWIKKFIHSINRMGADYIYMHDIDNSPCINGKKENLCEKQKTLQKEKLIIVVKEIESWYLAGLRDEEKLIDKKIKQTNNIEKESFNRMIPKRFNSRVDFMVEILKNYSVDLARNRNQSFNYFINRYNN